MSRADIYRRALTLESALAEKDARIEALERALRELFDGGVVSHAHGSGAGPLCRRCVVIANARMALAPAPSNECPHDHTAHEFGLLVCQRCRTTVKPPAPSNEKPCATCGGSGLVRNPYPPPTRGMRLEPCPRGCTPQPKAGA